jgi:hypothetical protein
VFIPMQLLNVAGHDRPILRLGLFLITFGMVAVLLTLRRRATKYISATLTTSAVEASKFLNTPTWRGSAWRRTPTASLLVAAAPAPPSAESVSSAAETRLAAAIDDERSTQAS